MVDSIPLIALKVEFGIAYFGKTTDQAEEVFKLFDAVIGNCLIRIIKVDQHIIDQISIRIIEHADLCENIEGSFFARRIIIFVFDFIKRVIQPERNRFSPAQLLFYFFRNDRVLKNINPQRGLLRRKSEDLHVHIVHIHQIAILIIKLNTDRDIRIDIPKQLFAMIQCFVCPGHLRYYADDIGNGREPLIVFEAPHTVIVDDIDSQIAPRNPFDDQRNHNQGACTPLLQITFFFRCLQRQFIQVIDQDRIKLLYLSGRPA